MLRPPFRHGLRGRPAAPPARQALAGPYTPDGVARPPRRRRWPKATDWIDDEDDYRVNEIAINWNATLVYALAGFLSGV